MKVKTHSKVTGFSGNEIFCLKKLGYEAGQLCLGNNVLAMGVRRGIGAGLSNLAGGEITEITNLIHEGRKNAYNRMLEEARQYGGVGLAGVSFDIVSHTGNFEFIALGSTIHQPGTDNDKLAFSTAASGQELYCQMDAGFKPHSFVFSNVAYSIGLGGGITGAFRGLKRGEVPQYTQIFDRTRHLALTRIQDEAKALNANAVIGINTSIIPLFGAQEMMMMGTASSHPALSQYSDNPVTSDTTSEEMWNLVNMGYLPIKLVMGVSVYSLGFVSGVGAFMKSLAGGQVQGLTDILYEAREKAFERVNEDAKQCGADEVVGVKTHVYDLGGGLVEFMVIGTAVKKVENVTTKNDMLLPQAIIRDRETFIESKFGVDNNVGNEEVASATKLQKGPLSIIAIIIVVVFYMVLMFLIKS